MQFRMRIVEACTGESSGSENVTAETDVNLSYTEAGFLVIDKQIILYNPQGQSRRERPRKSWWSFLKKEIETVSKTLKVVKAIPGKRLNWLCFVKALRSETKKEEFALLAVFRHIHNYLE